MQHRHFLSSLSIFSSPQFILGGLTFFSINLFFSVARYYVESFPILGLMPLMVYLSTIVLVLTARLASNHNRLLLTHAYVTLPLVIPLFLPLVSGFFIYLSCLVVLFFNALIFHNEMQKQVASIHSPVHCLLAVTIGASVGAIVAFWLATHISDKSLPFLFSVVGGCFFRSNISEPPFIQNTTSSFLADSLWGKALQQKESDFIYWGVVKKYITYMQKRLLQILHIKRSVIQLILAQSVARKVPLLLIWFGIFVVLLVSLGAIYRYIILPAGTENKYIIISYMATYCLTVTLGCFFFRANSIYFGLSLGLTALSSLFFLGNSQALTEPIFLGKVEFSIEVLMLFTTVVLSFGLKSPVLFSTQSRYGELDVIHNRINNTLELLHDDVIQGAQLCDPDLRNTPISYYSKEGPFGQVMKLLRDDSRSKNIAIIGLGVGEIATYGYLGQAMTFYEIDPVIENIACHMGYFTYIKDSQASIKVVIGDGRESIATVPDNSIGILICDAYLEKTVPNHLLTKEAFSVYLDKLEEHGLLMIDITNSTERWAAILAKIAEDLGIVGYYRQHNPATFASSSHVLRNGGLLPAAKPKIQPSDPAVIAWLAKLQNFLTIIGISADNEKVNKQASWAVLARTEEDVAMLAHDARWKRLQASSKTTLLTDAKCNYNSWERTIENESRTQQ